MDNSNIEDVVESVRPQCGTRAGHIQHYKKGEKYCNPCVIANREYQKAFRKTKTVSFENRVPATVRRTCGTRRGSDFHAYYGELACEVCKENYSIRSYEYYKENVEKTHIRNRKWRKENPEAWKASQDKWRKENPEKIASKNRRQRAVKLGVISEPYTTEQVLNVYGSVCHICNEEINLEAPRSARGGENWEKGLQIDHVIPLSKGGVDTIENVKPSHGKCNLIKRDALTQ